VRTEQAKTKISNGKQFYNASLKPETQHDPRSYSSEQKDHMSVTTLFALDIGPFLEGQPVRRRMGINSDPPVEDEIECKRYRKIYGEIW
jgi:hypothetical protein